MSYDELELDRIGDRKTAVFFTIPTQPRLITSLWPWPFHRCSIFCVNGRTMFTGAACPIMCGCCGDEAANTGQVPLAGETCRRYSFPRGESVPVLPAVRAVQGHLQRQCGNDPGKLDSVIFLGGRESSTIKEFRELAGKGHDLHADRGPLPWAVGKLQPEHPAAGPGTDDTQRAGYHAGRQVHFAAQGPAPILFRPNTI